MRVTLKPYGDVDRAVLEHLVAGLARFGEVETAPRGAVPLTGFDPKRNKYRAAAFLDASDQEPGDLVLAITREDLYDPGLSFVFGLAVTRGRTAVISTARLSGDGPAKLVERSLKEAVHEIGHLLGLDHHRDNPECVMFFSKTLEDTDRKEASFCGACNHAAEFTLKRLRK